MRLLITGSNGATARYFAEYARAKGAEVSGLSRENCEMESPVSMQAFQPEAVLHLAADADVAASFRRAAECLDNNIRSTVNLFEACRALGRPPLIVSCSTSEVYGNADRAREDAPLCPRSPYAVSKAAQDMLSRMYFEAYGLPVITTRMFTYINPRRHDTFASAFARQVVAIERGRQEVLRHGNLDSVRTIMGISDACEAYWLALTKCEPGEVYNIGGGAVMRVGAFLDRLVARSGIGPRVWETDAALFRPADVVTQIPDATKFCQLTGWKARGSLDENIDMLLAYWRGMP